MKRDWEKDNVAISAKLKDMEEGRFPQPFWIGVYPEGTRITPEKMKLSQEYARGKGGTFPSLLLLLLMTMMFSNFFFCDDVGCHSSHSGAMFCLGLPILEYVLIPRTKGFVFLKQR